MERKMTRVERKRRRRRRFARLVFLLLLTCIFLYYLKTSKFFNIAEIQIEGTKIIDKNEIIDKTKDFYDKNLIFISKSDIIDNIGESAYIKNIKVRKKLAKKIIIEIEEREEELSCRDDLGLYITDINGMILRESQEEDDFCKIYGLGKNEEGDSFLFKEDKGNFLLSLKKKEILDEISDITFEENGEVTLNLKDQTLVDFGKIYDYEYKIDLLIGSIKKARQEGAEFNRVIMNKGDNIILVTQEKEETNEE